MIGLCRWFPPLYKLTTTINFELNGLIFIAIISFAFGLFFDLLINQMKTFDYENRIIEGLFIPAMAIVNMIFIFLVIRMYGLITLSLLFVLFNIMIYGLFFILPYLIGYTARKLRG